MFQLTDMKFATAEFEQFYGSNQNDILYFAFKNAYTKIVFQYKFQQKTYPYASGSGSGLAHVSLNV